MIAPPEGHLLVTTDMLNEGVHFDLSYTSAYCLGFKLISINVSDIYAMGGQPHAVFVSLGLPNHTSEPFFWELYEGINEALSLYGLDLLGGDLCSTTGNMTLSATVVGSSLRPIYRSGANKGDVVYVTGNLGESALGLNILKRMDQQSKELILQSRNITGIENDPISIPPYLNTTGSYLVGFLKRHLMPIARDLSPILSHITSMIDISDGFFIDLCRLCDESQVSVIVFENSLPMTPALLNTAPFLELNSLMLATQGGEDYEMLFTLPPEIPVPHIEGLKITPIGEIKSGNRLFIYKNGKECLITPSGYEHFRMSE